jgi:hypothetical protein
MDQKGYCHLQRRIRYEQHSPRSFQQSLENTVSSILSRGKEWETNLEYPWEEEPDLLEPCSCPPEGECFHLTTP